MEPKGPERPGSGSKPPASLLGGAGGKMKFGKPAADLTPDQLKARREYNRAATKAHRARKKEFPTKGGLAESVAKKRADRIAEKERIRTQRLEVIATRVAEREAKKVGERKARAEARRVFREQLAAEKKNWNKSLWNKRGERTDLRISGVGAGVRRNRNKVRTQLRRIFKDMSSTAKARDWRWVEEEMDRARAANLPLEIRGNYSIHDGTINKWTIDGGKHRDPEVFLRLCRSLVKRVVDDTVGNIKRVELILNAGLVRPSLLPDSEEDETDDHRFRSGIHDVLLDSDFDEVWDGMHTALLIGTSEHQGKGSGWVLEKINELSVHVDIANPLSGRSHIPLPKWVRYKRAVVNLKNSGDDCFPLAVAAAEMLRANPGIRDLHRIPKILRAKASNLNMGSLELPMKITDISKFEDLNPTIRLSIFGIGRGEIVTVLSKRRIGKKVDTLPILFWDDGDGNSHYSPIRSLSALFGNQVSKNCRKMNLCENCLCRFTYSEDLKAHEEAGDCFTHKCQETQYVNEIISFRGLKKTQRVPFVVYSDIESFNIPIKPPEIPKNTVKLSEQTPSGLGYCIVGPSGYKNSYRRFDTVADYATALVGDVRRIHRRWFSKEVPIVMTPKDTADYERSTECYKCGCYVHSGKAGRKGDRKVRDHDRFTGEFRGAACNTCNLAMVEPGFIPVYFHNLEGYDSHLLILEISKLGEPSCIPRDKENYISFSVRVPISPLLGKEGGTFEIRFLDSFKLMSSGLSSLVDTLGGYSG